MAITMRPPASLEIEDMYYINASVQALSAQLVSTTMFPIEKMGKTLLASVKLLASFLEPTQPPVSDCDCVCLWFVLLDPIKPHTTHLYPCLIVP